MCVFVCNPCMIQLCVTLFGHSLVSRLIMMLLYHSWILPRVLLGWSVDGSNAIFKSDKMIICRHHYTKPLTYVLMCEFMHVWVLPVCACMGLSASMRCVCLCVCMFCVCSICTNVIKGQKMSLEKAWDWKLIISVFQNGMESISKYFKYGALCALRHKALVCLCELACLLNHIQTASLFNQENLINCVFVENQIC